MKAQATVRAIATEPGEEGYLLVGVIVLVALVLLTLSVAAPKVAFELRHEKEIEAEHRGQQYIRAIRMYYQKFGSYPATVKQLEGTNNIRFLRQHYLDPFTGKDDWRLIPVGQNKTTVKGFFGQPLAGLPTGGLGSAAGMSSGFGAGATTGGSGTMGTSGASGTTGTSGNSGTLGSSSSSGSAFGSTGSSNSGFGSSSSSSGFGSSSSGSAFGDGGSTGPFMGVGLPVDKTSIVTLNEQTNYSAWEFLYASGTSGTAGAGTTGSGSTPPQ